jgi:peptidoglycan/LPS O-acetylase OafA/YrhL
MPNASTAPTTAARFRTIDGLRGIAALSVAIFHFNGGIIRTTPDWIPAWAQGIATNGFLGVEVFFVISGFVIAFSVRDGSYSGRYLGLFALRRSIRLDPPYWLTIALELVLLKVSAMAFPSVAVPMPNSGQMVSHFFYLQDVLGYGGILPIFWTLCFEIQFYLLLVGLLVLWHKSSAFLSDETRKMLVYVVLSVLFVSSVFLRYSGWHLPIPGIALERWFQFFLGVLTYWVFSGRISMLPLALAYGAVIGAVIGWRAAPIQILPVLVSAVIVAVGRRGRLDSFLGNRPLQFLGRTSYSFYLLHGPIGYRWISLLQKIVGPSFGIAWAWFAFISAIAICSIASALTWKLIEEPTMRFSKRIRLPTRSALKPVVGLPQEVPVTA